MRKEKKQVMFLVVSMVLVFFGLVAAVFLARNNTENRSAAAGDVCPAAMCDGSRTVVRCKVLLRPGQPNKLQYSRETCASNATCQNGRCVTRINGR